MPYSKHMRRTTRHTSTELADNVTAGQHNRTVGSPSPTTNPKKIPMTYRTAALAVHRMNTSSWLIFFLRYIGIRHNLKALIKFERSNWFHVTTLHSQTIIHFQVDAYYYIWFAS